MKSVPNMEVKLILDELAYLYYKGEGYNDAPCRIKLKPYFLGKKGFAKLIKHIDKLLGRKNFNDELRDFLEDNNLDLISRETSATVSLGSEKDWSGRRYGEEGKDFATLNGAIKYASK